MFKKDTPEASNPFGGNSNPFSNPFGLNPFSKKPEEEKEEEKEKEKETSKSKSYADVASKNAPKPKSVKNYKTIFPSIVDYLSMLTMKNLKRYSMTLNWKNINI